MPRSHDGEDAPIRSSRPQRGKSPRRGRPTRNKSDESGSGDSQHQKQRRARSKSSLRNERRKASNASTGGNSSSNNNNNNNREKEQYGNGGGGGSNSRNNSRSSDTSVRSNGTRSSDSVTAGANVLDSIPKEYLKRPDKAEPVLHYLPKMIAATGGAPGSGKTSSSSSSSSASSRFPNLRVLLAAAQDDIRLHRARQQAGKSRDPKLLQTYKIETDPHWLSRQQRLNERELLLGKLDTERSMILKELLQGNTSGLTAKEATAIQLARWQRALELYVYHPPYMSQTTAAAAAAAAQAAASTSSSFVGNTVRGQDDSLVGGVAGPGATSVAPSPTPKNLDFLGLLEKLMETSAEVSVQCC